MAGNPGKEKQKEVKKEGKGDAQRKHGSSPKDGDLNSWDEVAVEKAWLEYRVINILLLKVIFSFSVNVVILSLLTMSMHRPFQFKFPNTFL